MDVKVLSWFDGEGGSVFHELSPGIAVSPDGRHLALVHADIDRVTLIDAETLRVKGGVALTRPRAIGERMLRWLGLLPEPAAAKLLDGRVVQAVFAPDGRHLYVFGAEGETGEPGVAPTERGLGLTLIDLETGAIVAEGLADEQLDEVLPAPDGRSLYTLGPTVPWTMAAGEPDYRLHRLDARTLAPLAEREFPGSRRLVLLPLAFGTG